MGARRTFSGYPKDCLLKGAVVDLEDTGVPVSFDGREWPRMRQGKTREQEYQKLTSGKPLA